MEPAGSIDRSVLLDALSGILPGLQTVLGDGDYRLVGNAAALLWGCEIHTADVDFLMRDRRHVDAFSEALSGHDCLVSPTFVQWSPAPREAGQYWCRYDVRGGCIEASTVGTGTNSDCIEASGSGPWTHYVNMAVSTFILPTVRIELRSATELSRNRANTQQPILDWIIKNGCDLNLLERAMEARRVPAKRQRAVLSCLLDIAT